MASVVLEHVEKRYGRAAAPTVRDLSLVVKDHELLVLVGPSGCGKSTLLRMIAGLESVDGGALFIGERRVNDVPPKDRDVAMVFQSYALYPHMTCYENMAFALGLRRVPRDEIETRVLAAARALAIEPCLPRRPKELSGGQRQRVAIGRAIVREPQVFLMDEPLSNVDAKLRVSMRAEIKRLQQSLNATIVYVTHDQTEAMTLGDRIAVLRAGELVQVDTPEAIHARPATAFVATFIGSPEMNLLPGEIGPDGLVGPGYALDLRAPAPRAVLVGARPEHVRLVSVTRPGAGGEDDTDHGSRELRGRVVLVESTGSDSFIHTDTVAGRIVFKHGELASFAPRVGDLVSLALEPRQLHLFDRATEARIE